MDGRASAPHLANRIVVEKQALLTYIPDPVSHLHEENGNVSVQRWVQDDVHMPLQPKL